MTSPLSLGFVGSPGRVVPPEAALVGVVGETTAQTADWAREAGAQPFANAADLAGSCDVVAVASDPAQRAADARAALGQGAHVFAAWPPAASVEEAEGLAARAEEAGAEVAVERPLPLAAVVAARPEGWAARLVALDLAGADPTEGLDLPWPRRLAGALDAVMALVRSGAIAHLDVQADREDARVRSFLASLRFKTGAYAHIGIRDEAEGWPQSVRLAASGGGVRLSARSLRGPICIEGAASVPEPDATGLAAFVASLAHGHVPASGPGALALSDAVALMRLAERVQAAMRGPSLGRG
ncbi:Gfo/Idh/MocA family oxidoreductase [Rubricoccus marinus]|uniref:Gfo/Idh/MocA-like oxidoreductase N-terminal domain-containing protein n=1 Tax=Rubricoccus marinus TaxID=716817 RepID=A0A259U2P5_9BACT|nr:Gfo/Idh/MocA family oxidoreductase [Rubricoccus marinus]OZC04127.1 hypothetical protein BSZ36_14735 [Rubricoccus marinus]